jgi:hypothetical protein
LVLAIALAGVLVLGVIELALVLWALAGIFAAALYRYAANNDSTRGFNSEALRLAFAPKS